MRDKDLSSYLDPMFSGITTKVAKWKSEVWEEFPSGKDIGEDEDLENETELLGFPIAENNDLPSFKEGDIVLGTFNDLGKKIR